MSSARLCHWCFKRAPRGDLLRFPHDGLWAKLCGDCRATKWEAEKQTLDSGKEQEGMHPDNAIAVTSANDDYFLNKSSAKRKYHLTDSDLATLKFTHLFPEKVLRELARRRWGGDEGIEIRCQLFEEAQKARQNSAKERDEKRRAEIRSYIGNFLLEKLEQIHQILEETSSSEFSFSVDASITEREWDRLLIRTTVQVDPRRYLWTSVYEDPKCYAPGSSLKPKSSQKRKNVDDEGDIRKHESGTGSSRNSQLTGLTTDNLTKIVSWLSGRLLRIRLVDAGLKSLGYLNGFFDRNVVLAALPKLMEFVALSSSTSVNSACWTPDEIDNGLGMPAELRGSSVTTLREKERKSKYVDAVRALEVRKFVLQIDAAVRRVRTLIER
ncbi:hypothetical protein HDU93_004746, partial [Gonapodya sp. JEL0774]